jgi:hypothetical protein
MSAEADPTFHAHLVVILNECLLSAAKSGDIPKLQVLRYVLRPIRALTDPGSHSNVAELGCRSCCDMAPMSRIETGAFEPAGAQGSRLRRTFRSCNLRAYRFHWPTRIRISHVGRTHTHTRFAQTTRTGRDCQ